MKTILVVIIAILSLSLVSCQDFNNIETVTTDDVVLKSAEVAVNDITVENTIEEVSHEAEMFAESENWLRQLAKLRGNRLSGNWKRYKNDENVEVTIDTSETRYPMTITIDYGEATELENGRVMSGTIVIEISAAKNTDGATKSVNYNCTLDTISIAGTSNSTFTGDNETSKAVSSSSDITFTLTDGTVVERDGSHTRTWLSGIDTKERDDDIIHVDGSTNLTASTGDSWSKTITETLVKDGSCKHYVEGVKEISSNGVVSTLDYGDGECDNIAILTVDGESIEIELGGDKPKANTGDRGQKKGGNKS